jgi:hypothetical protein
MSNKPFLFTPGSMDKLQHTDVAHSIEVDEERSSRIKTKYQKLVDDGLYEQQDGRSFTHALFTAIVHFPSKTIWVYTFPIIAAAPSCFIKTCKCGGILYKDLQPEHEEAPVDMEEVLNFIHVYLDALGDQAYVPSTAVPPQLSEEFD